MNRPTEQISFMKSARSICDTVKLIWKLDKGNLPSFMLDTFLKSIRPFVNLYFSAKILDELTGARDKGTLIWLAALTVGLNFLILAVDKLVITWHEIEGYQLYWLLYVEMSKTLIEADYKDVEGAGLHLKREKILDASHVYWCGPWEVPGILMNLVEGITTTLAAVALSYRLFLPNRALGSENGCIPWGSLLMLLLIAVSILYSLISEKKLYEQQEKFLPAYAESNRVFDFYTDYVKTQGAGKEVRLFRQKELLLDNVSRANREKDRICNEQGKTRSFVEAVRGVLAQATGGLAYLTVGLRAAAGELSAGSVVQYVGAVTQLSSGIRSLAAAIQHIKMQGPHCQDYLDFVSTQSAAHTGTLPVGALTDELKGGESAAYVIEFHHVSFRYPGTEEYVLKDLSLRLEPGKKLAVVGMNGSGKTTFIKLLCRLYDPTEGTICLNGTDIREYDYKEYLKLFSVVFQDYMLFAFSAAENVAASGSYDPRRVEACLELAGIGGRIKEMPKGIEHPLYRVDDDGIEISGGEAQKIAIARALYKNAPFVVLDEPTAALDPIAEADIYARFSSLVANKTAVYISHRLSSCRFCETIAVFDGGKLIQTGSHDQLVKDKDGKYYELWQAQAQYYVKDSAADGKQSANTL